MSDTRAILIDLPDELVGPRVVVRCYRDADAEPLWRAIDESRAFVGRWLPWPAGHQSVEDTLAYIRGAQARFILREDLPVGIFDRVNGDVLGGSGLHRINWEIRFFEIGYWVRASATGHGYVTEAVQLLTRLAFEHLQANRVQIRMDVANTRSRAIPERLGYVYEGCERNALPDANGKPRHVDMFALIPEEYRALSWASSHMRQ